MRAEAEPVDAAVAQFLNSFFKPARLLVAVSGGGDSVGLLIALDEALRSGRYPGFSLCACTIDHGLRPGSDAEARWMAALCAGRGIAHATLIWRGPKPQGGVQAAAREARHALLLQAARDAGADAILTAHNRDDQRETVAMRGARSDTGAGLAGIAPATLLHNTVWLLRPLLGVPREAIRNALRHRGQDWLEDPSNANRTFERVRVRLDATAGPEAARTASDAEEAGRTEAARARHLAAKEGGEFLGGSVRVLDAALAVLPVPAIATVQSSGAAFQALLALCAVLGGREHRLERAAAGRLAAFLESGALSRFTAGRVVFDRRREGLFLYREQRGIGSLRIGPGEVAVWDGRFRVRNLGKAPLLVQSCGAADDGSLFLPPDVPAGVARRAGRARPVVLAGEARAEDASHAIEPVLAPYDRYLPVFGLPLADAIAGLLGLPRRPKLPLATEKEPA
ncbi:tRNA lysidine(34) synthetase TilS [Rhizobium sp. GN54]|uniref:tRNA lysidine(34) synthetase TilS n=1 Tax=Rhizobium sp. GN54 TaxID=2898150 RepID=UPI001E52EF5C|nr:tRNA lysidine(34) synthetase TilS [Rhizobium sp. GN54]MCD2183189.1 tRNA lysidine(34) synthetase TilS [Rhizobium sp. GN54]